MLCCFFQTIYNICMTFLLFLLIVVVYIVAYKCWVFTIISIIVNAL